MILRVIVLKGKTRLLASCAMAAAILTGIIAPCAMADEAYIYIRTAADMKDLADKCVIDSYSAGKVVFLDGDIDLSGSGFEYIPYFSGTFEGGGHTISGFEMEAGNPERGFIGTVGQSGIVKNLNVKGKIEEGKSRDKESDAADKVLKIIDNISGDEKVPVDRYFEDSGVYSVGGMAGVNRGLLTGCGFAGDIDLNKNVGGIAGVNEGRIELCTNYAAVKGEENVGGIAGKNSGVIRWCSNYGRINDNAVEGMYATGGICGFSDGVIDASTNYAEVGYKNTGSATGGIVGAQNGHVSECRNESAVYGKKRVGGIVGNFEPYTNITYNPDDIQGRIDDAKEQVRGDLDDLSRRFDNDRENIKNDLDDFDSRLRNFFGVDDINSTVGNINGALDEISGSVANLNDTISDRIANGNSLASIADTLANAESDLSANNADLKSLLVQARDTAAQMSDATTSLADSLIGGNDSVIGLLDSINGNVSDSERRDKINDTIDAIDNTLDATSSAMDRLRTPSFSVDILDDTDNQLARSLKKINEHLDGLLDPFIKISGAFSDAYNTLAEQKRILEGLRKELEDWLDQLNIGNPSIPPIPPETTILPIETKAPDSAFGGLFVTAHAADNDDNRTTRQRLLDMDIHDIDIPLRRSICGEENEMALVMYCINTGEVTGSSDVGGISGGVGFGVSVGGSFGDINSDGKEFSLNPSTAIKSVISACINEGDVTAKATSAGGVTGFSDLGKIKDSINCGDIKVTDGSYAGGISGYNQNDVMRCINTGDVNAESDIGGIAGYGTNINQCYALTRTSSTGDRKGAIAGTVEGDIENNYFLKEKLGGINGVDYSGKAAPVTKETLASDGEISPELSGLEERYWTGTPGDLYMPQLRAFTENGAGTISDLLKAKSAACALFRFTVDFRIDGESVKTLNLDYGDKIPKDEIPKIPKINGEYGEWDKDVKEAIIRNTKFNAVYNRSTFTLSYGGEPPQILVEGDFNPDAKLTVEEFNPDAVIDDMSYKPMAGYSLMVTEEDKQYKDDLKVHVRVPKNNSRLRIGLITDSAVVITDSELDGRYLIFDLGDAERFIVLYERRSALPYIIIGLLLIGACVFLFLDRKRIKERRLLNKIKSFAGKTHIYALPSGSGEETGKEQEDERTPDADDENSDEECREKLVTNNVTDEDK